MSDSNPLSLDAIEATIIDEEYHPILGGWECRLTLGSGATVVGECKAGVTADVKRPRARLDAINKIKFGEQYTAAVLGMRKAEGWLSCDRFELAARVAHTVNKAFCEATGDMSQPNWEEAPEWQQDSARSGIFYHVENPDASPSNSHENWMAEKQRDGWTHGEVKDPDAKTHPSMVPFDDLPFEQRVKDHLFKAIAHAIAINPPHE